MTRVLQTHSILRCRAPSSKDAAQLAAESVRAEAWSISADGNTPAPAILQAGGSSNGSPRRDVAGCGWDASGAQWQPPEGTSWADLPSGSQLEQALTECVEANKADRGPMSSSQLDRARSRKYVALLKLSLPSTVLQIASRQCCATADYIVASYASRPGTEGGTPNANAPTTRQSTPRGGSDDHPGALPQHLVLH